MPLHDPRDLDEAIAAHEAGEALRRGELPPYLRRAVERRPGANRRGLRGFGGGGGAPAAAWLPSDITGVAEWWRADLGVTDAGGGSVSAWQGQIAGESLAQGTAGARPTLTTRDSQAVLSFDGGDLLVGAFATLGTLSTPGTLVAVFEVAGSGAVEGIVDGDDAAQRWEIYRDTLDRVIGKSGTARVAGTWSGMHAAVCGVGASAAGYVDDLTTPGYSAVSTGTETLDGLAVGGAYNGGTPLTGWVWEVILIDQAISAPDLALLGAYLDARYAGLSLTY